jgi:WD40 repeat protein
MTQGRELRRIPAQQRRVHSLSFSGDGRRLASAGPEPTVGLWDVATGQPVLAQLGHRDAVTALAASATDGTVFTAGRDGTIRHWDPSSGQELGLIARFAGPVEALALSPDGTILLVVAVLETEQRPVPWICLWSVKEHREIRRLARVREPSGPHYVAYSPDGKTVACEGRIWDVRSGKVLAALRHQDPRNDAFTTFCPIFYTSDGRQILTAEPDGTRVWDVATGAEIRLGVRWSNHHDRATLSPDGRFLATRGVRPVPAGEPNDSPIVVWELASGQEVARLEVHGEASHCRQFSPDGRFLATAGGRRGTSRGMIVQVWNLATAQEVRRFEGHRGMINALTFLPDQRSLVSASEDATAIVWDLSDLTDRARSDRQFKPESPSNASARPRPAPR